METSRRTLVFLGLVVLLFATSDSYSDHSAGHFTNDWVVRLSGGPQVADELASEKGYENLGELMGFPDTYLMRRMAHPSRSKREAFHLTRRLSDDHRVTWAEQQVLLKREKRGVRSKRHYRNQDNKFNDDLWPRQWYLHDTRAMTDLPQLDMRVLPVWDMGYTGKGVVVTVLDDGLEWNHTDIVANYDPEASWDTNNNDPDPFPRYDEFDSNSHGTRCVGEIAMKANNDKCGVGVAYDAKVGAIRMLDGDVSDATESVSLAFHVDHIDVFSASWGPSDDGMTLDGPKRLAVEALEKGVNEGRGGKGVIYVWASGNGGRSEDNCNCDGYTSSIYTLSIGSASQQGQFPWYGERCASTLATTFSSGAYRDQKISTSDLHNHCTSDHTGTSAAAPLAAGVVALVLQANPKLTWRDMQHLVAWTSDYQPLKHNRGWKRNGAGLMYNSRFGFGLMDAHAMVKKALNWTTVSNKTRCFVNASHSLPLQIESGSLAEVQFGVDESCSMRYLEHVEVTVNIEYPQRGALDAYLTSPFGSVTMLLSRRDLDKSRLGFRNWTFLTVHLWGERPQGLWTLLVRDKTGRNLRGKVTSVGLTIHGTIDQPAHMANGQRSYSDEQDAAKTVDPNKEFEEAEVSSRDDSLSKDPLDESESESNENDLDWDDLIGQSLRRLPERMENEQPEARRELPSYPGVDKFKVDVYDVLSAWRREPEVPLFTGNDYYK